MKDWVSTKDGYPDQKEHVLVFANDIVSSWVEIAFLEDGEWHTAADWHWPCLVDCWMSLPEPPKKDIEMIAVAARQVMDDEECT